MFRDNCVDTMPASRGVRPMNAPFGAPLSGGRLALTWHGWVKDGRRLAAYELARAWAVVKTWRNRAVSRSHLAQLDDRMLDDIGLSRKDAKRIAGKPFWKA